MPSQSSLTEGIMLPTWSCVHLFVCTRLVNTVVWK